MNPVLHFSASEATDLSLSGGKGSSLAKMAQEGLPVPDGCIVTAAGYRAFVDGDAGLAGMIDALSYDDPVALRAGCRAIREHLLEKDLPREMQAAIVTATAPLLDGGGAVAVRSSSTLEDLAGAAFAGQHDTFLHRTSMEEVLDAVRRCFASLWEDRAASYRHGRGFAHDRASMAVVIQRMAAAEAAGVAFTINPVTGNLDEVVVNSSWGLGETVVSGEGDVDEFVVDRKSRAMLRARIGEKSEEIVGSPSGPVKRELAPERRTAPSLDPATIAAVADVAMRAERFYGFPQDTEWAVAGGKVALLQARPVTSFPAKWTRAESAERFPNVVSPLTWDFVSLGFHASLAHSLRLMGMPAFEGEWFALHDHYVYGNETAIRVFTAGEQVAFSSIGELRALREMIRTRYQWVVKLPLEWARDLDHYLLSLGAIRTDSFASMSEKALLRELNRISEIGNRYFLPNIAISITHGIIHRMLYRLVGLLIGDRGEAAAMYDDLTCFCETKTNQVNAELREIADIVRLDAALLRQLTERPRRELWESGELERSERFIGRFRRFLRDHGHREVDFDMMEPTWSGQPWTVLENIRLMANEPPVSRHEREIALRERQQRAEQRLAAVAPEDLRYFAIELARLARAYTSLDDLEHYQTTRLSVPMRAAVVEIGQKLARTDLLERPEDVFFLTRAQLEQAVAGESEARSIARQERIAWERHRDTVPPFELGVEAEIAPTDGDLRGIPGSQGFVEGPVFRLRGPEDFARFPPGSILVARTTNPAWTPLFHTALAIVTESGGPLSHGAVTAREVGIPAVMGVRNAMQLFDDGVRLRVNGTTGIVSRL